jgi:hypothetical protein
VKKQKTLKRLSEKELSKLVGGAAESGSTWLYDCWEGTCTMAAKAAALKDPKNAALAASLKKEVAAKSAPAVKAK